MTMFSRAARQQAIQAAFADPATISATLGDVTVPSDIAAWLGRLLTMAGVPFGYLVPDEGMLPPESIRFFRLDERWVTALLDGAFSLGRNLTAEATYKHGDTVIASERREIALDGKTMSITVKDTGSGDKPMSSVAVYERR